MAKTQYSFSHDPKLKNVPSGKFGLLGGDRARVTDTSVNLRIHPPYSCGALIGRCWILVSDPG